jgi:hypothetical protein
MKTHFKTLVIAMLGMTNAAFAAEQASSRMPQLVVDITVDRYKDTASQTNWDVVIGADPAPDVQGKIQFLNETCEIPKHQDSYVVQQICNGSALKAGVPVKVSVQLYDMDVIGRNDIICNGVVEIKDISVPTEVKLESATLSFRYIP